MKWKKIVMCSSLVFIVCSFWARSITMQFSSDVYSKTIQLAKKEKGKKNIPCMSDCNWDERTREKKGEYFSETVIAFRLNLVHILRFCGERRKKNMGNVLAIIIKLFSCCNIINFKLWLSPNISLRRCKNNFFGYLWFFEESKKNEILFGQSQQNLLPSI